MKGAFLLLSLLFCLATLFGVGHCYGGCGTFVGGRLTDKCGGSTVRVAKQKSFLSSNTNLGPQCDTEVARAHGFEFVFCACLRDMTAAEKRHTSGKLYMFLNELETTHPDGHAHCVGVVGSQSYVLEGSMADTNYAAVRGLVRSYNADEMQEYYDVIKCRLARRLHSILAPVPGLDNIANHQALSTALEHDFLKQHFTPPPYIQQLSAAMMEYPIYENIFPRSFDKKNSNAILFPPAMQDVTIDHTSKPIFPSAPVPAKTDDPDDVASTKFGRFFYICMDLAMAANTPSSVRKVERVKLHALQKFLDLYVDKFYTLKPRAL
eukprot:gnl/Hemi2/9834_TR3420_c0_g1_i1.p1 gnl/Hemi2/9834_TR3420_c0_g1~~gnl/Hemi2/9834_TR3420_c0_g1_i1.p1  ORF type:complete len:321 (-),score=95.68 gnl/Hemi2/9834_TR3420_c0_g1_i1:159-1121(-)